MSLSQLWRILLAWRWTILAMTLTSVAVALLVAQTLPQRYTARARVLLDLYNADPNQFIYVSRDTIGPYIGTQIRLISEYDVTGQVVDKLGWLNDPNVITAWQNSTGGAGDVRRWAAARIADNTYATTVDGSTILEIGYSATDPLYAARVAGLLREAYISQTLVNRAAMAERAAAWSEKRNVKATAELTAAERARTAYADANGILLNRSGESVDLVELQQIGALLTTRNAGTGTRMANGVRSAAGAPGVVRLKSQLATMEQGVGVAETRLGDKNPEFKALQMARDRLQSNVARESAIARATGSRFGQLSKEEVAALEAKYRDKQREILQRKPLYDQFETLQRQVNLRRMLDRAGIESTLALKEMASVSESGLVVMGDVQTDQKPSYPDIPLIAALAGLLAFGLGIACALFTELRERKVRGAEDLAFWSQVPVIGTIGSAPLVARQNRWSSLPGLRWPRQLRFGRRGGLQPAE